MGHLHGARSAPAVSPSKDARPSRTVLDAGRELQSDFPGLTPEHGTASPNNVPLVLFKCCTAAFTDAVVSLPSVFYHRLDTKVDRGDILPRDGAGSIPSVSRQRLKPNL